MPSKNHFKFLNVAHTFHDDIQWNCDTMDKLWLYNLHYFDDLNADNNEQRQQLHYELIRSWIANNPPNYGNGWEPYTLSLRIVNWIKWCSKGNALDDTMLISLARQTDFLSYRLEFHILANHLLANAKALFFSGLFFNTPASKRWLYKGLKLLNEQFIEQILDDGAHHERSPMYHSIILEDILDCINICRIYDYPVNPQWKNKAIKMLVWLQHMTHPDGDISFFNDAALGIAPTLGQLIVYAKSLGVEHSNITKSAAFDSSGFAQLSTGSAALFIKSSPPGPRYQPGHTHADALSFELSLHHQRLIINSGTSTYNTCEERIRQRGSPAHNTITIDNLNSSNVWGSFRVAQRCKSKFTSHVIQKNGIYSIQADCIGYKSHVRHIRQWQLTDGKLKITDELTGRDNKNHTIEFHLHFYPGVSISREDNSTYQLRYNNLAVATLFIDPQLNVEIQKSTYHPEFGMCLENIKLTGKYYGKLPITLNNSLTWPNKSQATCQLNQL